MQHLQIARRYPSGVDRRFDDIAGGEEEFIRLARRGHMFGAALPTEARRPDEKAGSGQTQT